MQKMEKEALKVIHTLQYHVLKSFRCNLFQKKRYRNKGNLQLQGKGKNHLPYFFYFNFVFTKLKITNMEHNELPFVLLVFGI